MKNTFLLFLTLLGVGCTKSTPEKSEPLKPKVSGHVPVNGIRMYHEIYGEDQGQLPLVLIHGGGSTILSYSDLIPHLLEGRRVIAIEEQAHGRTTDRPSPTSFEATADDVAELMRLLSIRKYDVFGFSNGASSALQMAIRHPENVNKLVFVSSMTKKSGTNASFWEMFKHPDFAHLPNELKDQHLKVNPDPAALKNMFDRDSARMQSFKDVPDSDVKKVKARVLILQGDHDIPTLEHAVALHRTWQNSRLAVLPAGHGEFLSGPHYPQITARIVNDFLNETP